MGFGQLEWLRRKISGLLSQQRIDQKADMVETNTATQNAITNTIHTDNDVTRDEVNTLLWQDNDVTRDEIINNLRPLMTSGGGQLPTVTGIVCFNMRSGSYAYYRYEGKGIFYANGAGLSSIWLNIDDVVISPGDNSAYTLGKSVFGYPFSRYVETRAPSGTATDEAIIFFTT